MRVLFIAFELDDHSNVLAYQGRVANALAQHCEHLVAVAEKVGAFEPRDNVTVHALPGRPWGVPRKLGSSVLLNPFFLSLCRKHKIDACFIHMASSWAFRLVPAFRLLKLPVLVWHCHGFVSRKLKWIERCANRIVTASPEGFRLPSDKLHIIGHAIDTTLFEATRQAGQQNTDLIYVGRITSRKRIERLLDAMRLIKDDGKRPIRLRLIGHAVTKPDQEYLREMTTRAEREGLDGWVDFRGFIPMQEVPDAYRQSFLHINLCKVCGMDKAVLESMACGCPVLTSNEAFADFLHENGYPQCYAEDDSAEALASQITTFYETQNEYSPQAMRNLIVGQHDLDSYARKVIHHLEAISGAQPAEAERVGS